MSNKPDNGKRLLAFVIDALIAVFLGYLPLIGGIIGTLYMALRDGLNYKYMEHRSVGKTLMGLQVATVDGELLTIETSFRRNWMFAVGVSVTALFYIPVLGWALIPLAIFACLAIGAYEVFLVLSSDDGRRLGDQLANTVVTEEKESGELIADQPDDDS
jgi:uncharacterized RDD family membrane protein YckC